MRPTGPAHAAHFSCDLDRIGHDADEIRGVDDIEGVFRELQVGRVHLEQPDVADILARRRARAQFRASTR